MATPRREHEGRGRTARVRRRVDGEAVEFRVRGLANPATRFVGVVAAALALAVGGLLVGLAVRDGEWGAAVFAGAVATLFLYVLLSFLLGGSVLRIDGRVATISHTLFGIGRRSRFPVAETRGTSCSEDGTRFHQHYGVWIEVGERKFERVATGLSSAEAERLAQEIDEELSRARRKPPVLMRPESADRLRAPWRARSSVSEAYRNTSASGQRNPGTMSSPSRTPSSSMILGGFPGR